MGLPERVPEPRRAEVLEMPRRREPEVMQAALRIERQGDILKTVGWELLVFDLILVAFVWVGLRTGSVFWLIWVLAEAFLGLGLIRLGVYRRDQASRLSR